jgi:hypothetical protein
MFKVLRNYCGFKVNDVSKSNYPPKHGQRARYHWVCSKSNCEPCSESICPAIKAIAAQTGNLTSESTRPARLSQDAAGSLSCSRCRIGGFSGCNLDKGGYICKQTYFTAFSH